VCLICKTPLLSGEPTCSHCGYKQTAPTPQAPTGSLQVRTVAIVLLLTSVSAIATFVYLNFALVESDAYKDALTMALSSPEVQNAIGGSIRIKQPVFGYALPLRHSQFAEWSVVLAGQRGTGHLYGVANKVNGEWNFSRLAFHLTDGKEKIDLTPVRRLRLPSVPAKHVYFVPIGLDGGESLDWAPAYYRARLGVDVVVLPPVPLDPKLIDPERNQLNADKCFDFMKQQHPEIARDPSSLLIAVTSTDLYIPALAWRYAENSRRDGRYAIISSARLHPPLLGLWNPEWLNSRVQKLLTKNISILYFDLPMSADYTSLLSSGVLSGIQIDEMAGDIIGAEGRWVPLLQTGGPSVTIYDVRGKTLLWRMAYSGSALSDTSSQTFCASLTNGLLVERKTDFVFEDDPAMQFSRIDRNQDDRSRAFGVGGSDSFEIFLGGQMGVAVDLIMEDGARTHFVHQPPDAAQTGDTYLAERDGVDRFVHAQAVYGGGSWNVKTTDGWTYIFPYRPQALPQNVTVLTGFLDPEGHKYEMRRDSFGALIAVASPSGNWLHFENDSRHRIRKITSSLGRSMQYEYDSGGRMFRATDSDGHLDSYTYDEKGQMLTTAHGTEKPILTNEYFSDGYIKSQVMGDGRSFGYAYFHGERNVILENQITDPNGLETYIQYVPGGYLQWLPTHVPH
jgi:YD repeat-containing protein